MTILRRNLPWFAVLLVLPAIMLAPALLPGKALLPAVMLGKMLPWKGLPAFPTNGAWNPLQFDGIAQFYPWRLFAAQSYRSGVIPLWNPYQFCGTPFLANDQSAALYPLNFLYTVLPVSIAFGVSALLHLFLTGVFLFLLLRRRVSPYAALLGALIWQLSTWQIAWLALPTFLCTSAWIPLALLLIELCVDRPKADRGLALGLVLGVMLLAGHLQIAFYGLLMCVAYGVALLISDSNRGERWKLVSTFLLAGLVMILVSAPQMLPTMELARVSHRAGVHPTMGGYAFYVRVAMPWIRLVTLFVPSFFGGTANYWGGTLVPYPETACFVSIGGLVLAWAAITKFAARKTAGPDRLRVVFFAIVALVSLLIALGTPLDMLPYFGIPGFAQSGSPARILVLWSLSVAILAAYGLEVVRSEGLSRPALWLALASTVVPLMAAVIMVEVSDTDLLRGIDRVDLIVSIVILAAVIGAATYAIPTIKPGGAAAIGKKVRLVTIMMIVLVGIDLMRAGYSLNPVAESDQIYPLTSVISWLQEHASGSRIVVINAPNGVYEAPGVLPPNAATVYGLRDLQGYDSLQTAQYLAFLDKINSGVPSRPQENGNMALTHYQAAAANTSMAELDARWIVTPVPLAGLGEALASDGTLWVYAEPGVSSSRVRTAGSSVLPPDMLLDQPDRMLLRTHASGDLIIADQWYPGWRARVNGHNTRIDEAPDVFRTVPDVPAGAIVELAYRPAAFRLGLYLLCAALLVAGALGGVAIQLVRESALGLTRPRPAG